MFSLRHRGHSRINNLHPFCSDEIDVSKFFLFFPFSFFLLQGDAADKLAQRPVRPAPCALWLPHPPVNPVTPEAVKTLM